MQAIFSRKHKYIKVKKETRIKGGHIEDKLTGGPSSGGIIILLFPPGLISRIPSSNPA